MTKDNIDQITFSVAACAKALDISEDGVRRAIREGSIPAVRIGSRVLVLKQALIDTIQEAAGDLDKDTATLRAEEAKSCISGYMPITITDELRDQDGHVTGHRNRQIRVPGYDPRHPLNVARQQAVTATLAREAEAAGYGAPRVV